MWSCGINAMYLVEQNEFLDAGDSWGRCGENAVVETCEKYKLTR